MLKRFLADRSGSTAIEYALIAGLISVGILVGVGQTGTAVRGLFTRVGDDMNALGQ